MNKSEIESTQQTASALIDWMRQHESVVVAFSGGVDSSVVAAAAARALGDKALAVMSISGSVPARQVELAKNVANEIGILLKTIQTNEINNANYTRNHSDRCFFCKQTLYEAIDQVRTKFPEAIVASGTNADDLGDHRPGISAGRQAGVATPLADLCIGKQRVRELARHWQLSVAELPAGPCLASRIAYGESVTIDKLQMIDRAECWLKDLGFEEVRVRLHPGLHARIEVPADRIGELTKSDVRTKLTAHFRGLGFRFTGIDLEGFRSGSLNELVTLEP